MMMDIRSIIIIVVWAIVSLNLQFNKLFFVENVNIQHNISSHNYEICIINNTKFKRYNKT